MKVNIRETIRVIEDEYINGEADLADIAKRLNVSKSRLCQIGREFCQGWRQATERRKTLYSAE